MSEIEEVYEHNAEELNAILSATNHFLQDHISEVMASIDFTNSDVQALTLPAESKALFDEFRYTGGRFTSRLARRPKVPEKSALNAIRPRRLGGLVGGIGSDPFVEKASARGAGKHSSCIEWDDIPAFRHLSLLEEAIGNGSELPALPEAFSSSQRLAPMTGTVMNNTMSSSLRSGQKLGLGSTATSVASSTPRTPRILVTNGTWGLQPATSAAARRHASAAAPLGYCTSGLRGTSLPKKGSGAAATAMWIGTEGERLRHEARTPRSLDAMAAFLVNGGPERMTPLNGKLVTRDPAF